AQHRSATMHTDQNVNPDPKNHMTTHKDRRMDAHPLPPDIADCVRRALEEDIGSGDITARLIDASTQAVAHIDSRETAVICGTAWADEVLRQLAADVSVTWHVSDGDDVGQDQKLVTFQGNARALLTAERCMLNFLQTLSGTAT